MSALASKGLIYDEKIIYEVIKKQSQGLPIKYISDSVGLSIEDINNICDTASNKHSSISITRSSDAPSIDHDSNVELSEARASVSESDAILERSKSTRDNGFHSVTGRLLAWSASVVILLYVFLLGASHVYVSSKLSHGVLETSYLWDFYEQVASLGLPGLTDYGPIRVNNVDGGHLLRNLIFLICSAGLMALMPSAVILVGIAITVWGVLSINGETSINGIILSVIGPFLAAIAAVVLPVVYYLFLLFQPSSDLYTLAWIFVGLPFFIGGLVTGGSPSLIIIKIFIKD